MASEMITRGEEVQPRVYMTAMAAMAVIAWHNPAEAIHPPCV